MSLLLNFLVVAATMPVAAGELPYIYGAQYYRAPTPARENWDGDLANIRQKGFNTVKFWVQWRWSERREGEYHWDDLDELMRLAEKHGLKVVLNLILDVMPEWVERDYPDSLMVDIDGKPVRATAPSWRQLGGYPGPCYSHRELTKKRQRFTRAAYSHFKDAPALFAWDVWNEPERIAAHRTNDLVPALCFCDSCRRDFRLWLARRYGTIERLNDVWGRCYTSFDAVEAPVDVRCISDFIDWRAFQRDVLHRDAAWRLDMLREIDPARHPHLHVVTAINGFSPAVAVDDFTIARSCEIFGSTMVNSPYACVAGLSAAQGRYYYNAEWHLNFGSIGSFQRVIGRDLFMYDQLSQIGWGIKGCLFWQFRSEVLGTEAPAWGLVRPDGSDRPVVRHAEEFIKAFQPYAADYLRCRRPAARVLVWRSADNETFHYCRYNGVKRYHDGIGAWCDALYALNVPFALCDTEMLESGVGDAADVLVLPQAMYLRRRDVDAFRAFAKTGKTILSEVNVGAYDADSGRFSPTVPGFGLAGEWDVREAEATSVFHLPTKTPATAAVDGTDDVSKALRNSGATGDNYFSFDAADGAKGLGAWDFAQLESKHGEVTARFGGVPMAVRTRTASGCTVFYFGTQLGSAAAEKKDDSFLRHALATVLKSAGISADDADGLHIDTLEDENGAARFTVLVNRGEREVPVRLPSGEWKELFGGEVKTLRPKTAVLFVKSQPDKSVRIGNSRLSVDFNPRDGSFEVTDRESGRVWRSGAEFARDRFAVSGVKVVDDTSLTFDLAVPKPSRLRFAARLSVDGGELEVSLAAPPNAEFDVDRVGYPFPFSSRPEDRFYFPNGCGLTFPSDVSDPSGMGDDEINDNISVGQCCYRLVFKMGCWIQYEERPSPSGALEQGAGVLAIVPTPWDFCMTFVPTDHGRRTAGIDWTPALGKVEETRRVRFCFFPHATPGRLARRYRREMEERGLRVTFAEKASRNPRLAEGLDLLQGAPDVWYWTEKTDRPAVARELKRIGFDNFLLSAITRHDLGCWITPEEVKELRKIPRILVCEYDVFRDTMEPSMLDKIDAVRPHWPLGVWEANEYVMERDGTPRRGWKVALKDQPNVPSVACLLLCEKMAPKYVRDRLSKSLSVSPYNARFLDVTGTGVDECWNPAHPLSRRQSMVARQDMFKAVHDEFSLVTGTEGGLECYVPCVDYFEGIASTSYWFVDGGRKMWEIYEETPAKARISIDPTIRYPFWEMCFRDCVVGYPYWSCYNNKFPQDWWKMDLLSVVSGTPPMYMFTPEVLARQKERLAESYKVATSTARAAKGATMDEFRWLTADRLVQESEFSNGLTVTANFSDRPFTMKDGRILPPHGYLQTYR